jgi:hypothetical protein
MAKGLEVLHERKSAPKSAEVNEKKEDRGKASIRVRGARVAAHGG